MILLDTNIISEIMRPAPSQAVLNWLNRQEPQTLYLSTITIGEIEYGLRILPDGKRRNALRQLFNRFVSQAFSQRILPFEEKAARLYGEIMGQRKELGRPMSIPDGQIAAIAVSQGIAAIATRNIRDFEECGIALINPYQQTN